MAKKRLSDLLREEVNTPAIPQGEVTTPPETAPVASETQPTSPKSLETTPPPKLASEAESTELNKALQTANERIKTLQDQVNKLELELEQKTNLIQTLQEQLQPVDQLQKELETQKSLITKLNTELAEAEPLKSELKTQKQLVEKLYAELQTIEAEKTPSEPTPEAAPQSLVVVSQSPHYLRPQLPMRYVASTAPSTILSDEEIGWFD